MENLAKIEAHNADKTQTYEQGVNQFSAMTQEEFAASYLGYIEPQGQPSDIDNVDIPSARWIDWTEKNAVTPIKDQKNCGSCWAFSTTGSL